MSKKMGKKVRSVIALAVCCLLTIGMVVPNLIASATETTTGTVMVVVSGPDSSDGMSVDLYGKDTDGNVVSMQADVEDGTAVFKDVPESGSAGYTLTELNVPSWWEPVDAKSVAVTAGNNTDVLFEHAEKTGSVSVVKAADDGAVSGVEFLLSGTAASGKAVSVTAVTDESGTALFSDLPISDADGYTLTETETDVKYVIPAEQNVSVAWDTTISAQVVNTLKTFCVQVTMPDETIGDASLSGAVYGLYQDGDLVESFVTDASGVAVSSYYTCGGSYVVKQISPSEGYQLDDTEYTVDADAAQFMEAQNMISVSVSNTPIQNRVVIIKHSDDGSTGVETPEAGSQFEVYLASAGSYEDADDSVRDILITNSDGYAESKLLPYGVYTVHQTVTGTEEAFIEDFTVFIEQDVSVADAYKYLVNNGPYMSYILVNDLDSESNARITSSSAGFEIYDSDGNKVTMSYTYPEYTEISVFYTNSEGYLMTPEALPSGSYKLVQVSAPYGYVLEELPVTFIVTNMESTTVDGLTATQVNFKNMPQKSTISLTVTGDVFYSIENDGMYEIPVYKTIPVSDVAYEIIANENIVTGDSVIHYAAGDVVASGVTGYDGTVVTDNLYLGSYIIQITSVPDGYVIPDAYAIELAYVSGTTSVTTMEAEIHMDHEIGQVSFTKSMEFDGDIDGSSFIQNVSFGLYAVDVDNAYNGDSFSKNALIETAYADANGTVSFTADLPAGTYAVKELTTGTGYVLDDTSYEVAFAYDGTAVHAVAVNDGEAIENQIIRGTVSGILTDDNENVISGAVFGLFSTDTDTFTEDTAVSVVMTDESGSFTFEDIIFGDYVIVELSTADGYTMPDARYYVSITYDAQKTALKVVNYADSSVDDSSAEETGTGTIAVTMTAEDDADLAGLTYGIYNEAGTEVIGMTFGSGEEGASCVSYNNTMDAAYGTYTYVIIPADGYTSDNTGGSFTISEENPDAVITAVISVKETDVTAGTIVIQKVDAENTDTVLSGAEFTVFESDGTTSVAAGTTDSDGNVTFTLEEGTYYYQETAAPDGYILNTNLHQFAVTAGSTMIIRVTNLAETSDNGELIITKTDASDGSLLEGAVFEVYDADGNTVATGTTDENGSLEIVLPYGTYTYQETVAPDGYILDSTTRSFTLSSDQNILEQRITNTVSDSSDTDSSSGTDSTSDTDNTSDSTSTSGNVVGTETSTSGQFVINKVSESDQTVVLSGATFQILDGSNNKVLSGTTDENGQVTFNLEPGTYYFQETGAPSGYVLDDTKSEITVYTDGTTTVTRTNAVDTEEETSSSDGSSDSSSDSSDTTVTGTVKTGDTSHVVLWVVLICMAAALCGACGFVLYHRRKADEE